MTGVLKCFLAPLLFPLVLSCCSAVDGGETDLSSVAKEGGLAPAASMRFPRSGHTATLLQNGKVLIAGGMNGNGSYFDSTEIYDPRTNAFTEAQRMSARRVGHTATLLPNGKVLIAGGFNGDYLQTADLYDPSTGRFTPTGGLIAPRSDHLAVLLNNGKVLLIGGVGVGYTFLASAEIYDPATEKFTATGNLTTPREGHTATLLKDGRVLVTGGHKDRREAMTVYSSAELYDPLSGRFTATGSMSIIRHKHGAALLPDGNVLIVGGSDKRDSRGQYASAEIYDLARGVFKEIGNMSSARYKLCGAVVTMRDGRVLVAGGSERVEIYDPAKKDFNTVNGQLDTPRFFSSATLLEDGRVFVAGGYDNRGTASEKAWIYSGSQVRNR